ncbi:MAG: CYTH domain-containing protein [Eubacteriales bacterium]|nr:CYTH domain-containing protein [Eubacteriales bacterium]
MEMEYKYRVPDIDTFRALTDAIFSLGTPERIGMDAEYFDTPDRRLRAASVTLRLRRETRAMYDARVLSDAHAINDARVKCETRVLSDARSTDGACDADGACTETVCCVKLPAPEEDAGIQAGLRRRLEFECAADTVEEGVRRLLGQGLPREPLENALGEPPELALREGLCVSAVVRYTRLTCTVRGAGGSYTVCLDRGVLGKEDFMELEIEHGDGDFAVTAEAARAFARKYALEPELRSKYARALV